MTRSIKLSACKHWLCIECARNLVLASIKYNPLVSLQWSLGAFIPSLHSLTNSGIPTTLKFNQRMPNNDLQEP